MSDSIERARLMMADVNMAGAIGALTEAVNTLKDSVNSLHSDVRQLRDNENRRDGGKKMLALLAGAVGGVIGFILSLFKA